MVFTHAFPFPQIAKQTDTVASYAYEKKIWCAEKLFPCKLNW